MVVPCSGLHSGIKKVLFEQLDAEVSKKCFQEHGHILQVLRIRRILSHEISRVDSNLIFVVEYDARTLKPYVGMESKGEICMVYPDGLFVNIYGCQKVLIPSQLVQNNEEDAFETGDIVNIELTAVKYTGTYFNCIGRLKDL